MTDARRHVDMLLEQHILVEESNYKEVIERLEKLEESNRAILEMWTQAKGALTFLKVLSVIGIALAGTYTFLTTNFTVLPK